MAQTAPTEAALQRWFRRPADLIVLGLAWLVVSLPLVTVGVASAALIRALIIDDDASGGASRRFLRGVSDTWRPALLLSAIAVPALAIQIAVCAFLVTVATAPALIGLGVFAVVSLVAASFGLVAFLAVAEYPKRGMSRSARAAALLWLSRPGPSITAVIVGLALAFAAAQVFVVLAVFVASVPALIVFRAYGTDAQPGSAHSGKGIMPHG